MCTSFCGNLTCHPERVTVWDGVSETVEGVMSGV